ncbi:hypothetical protein [Caulobacter henricii]|uniref:Uncharacterized protein n=1 Tax=Caulobacter henricii TaxID=69395 RepID=A0A0P0NVU7_9CAUL|nr:hypothetical protein [Caulobacter henricii]ALL11933.1 hypothetical protein AQ619_00285 [Caulobacter henricii]
MSGLTTLVHEVSAEEIAEFKRGLSALGPQQRRILAVLIPRLIALEERGDPEGAIRIIDEIRAILMTQRRTCH